MATRQITARVMLHGFPELGLGGGSRPSVDLMLADGKVTGREVFKALMERFGPALEPILEPARHPGGRPKNVHLFANDKAIQDADAPLDAHVDAAGRINILLILVKAIAGG